MLRMARWRPQRVCNKMGRERVPGPCHGTRNAWEQTITRQDSYLFLNQDRTKCHARVTVCHNISKQISFSIKVLIRGILDQLLTLRQHWTINIRESRTLHFTTRRKLLRRGWGGAMDHTSSSSPSLIGQTAVSLSSDWSIL